MGKKLNARTQGRQAGASPPADQERAAFSANMDRYEKVLDRYQALSDDPPSCPPVWQYLLIMGREMAALARLMVNAGAPGNDAPCEQIIGLVEGLAAIGEYHTAEELEPLAEWADALLDEWRPKLRAARPKYSAIAAWLEPKVVELRGIVEALAGWARPY